MYSIYLGFSLSVSVEFAELFQRNVQSDHTLKLDDYLSSIIMCQTLSLTYHSICALFVYVISTMCPRLAKCLAFSVISGSGFYVFVHAVPTECQTFTSVFFLISFYTVSRHSTSKLTWSECMDFSDTQTYTVSDLEGLKRFLNQGLYLRIEEEKVQKIRLEG